MGFGLVVPKEHFPVMGPDLGFGLVVPKGHLKMMGPDLADPTVH